MSATLEQPTQHDEQVKNISVIPLDQISRDPANPRKFFNQSSLDELAASIKSQGLIQPIVLRDNPDGGYLIVAGERRFRACQIAGLSGIPAIIKSGLDVEDALVMAGHENIHREDMSYAEEAFYAREVLGNCGGDLKEACRRLAWSEKTLRARLLLLHATEAVLTALTERKILLGHAELLAGIPAESQDGTLARVIEEKISVEALRARIDQFALELSSAIFNKDDCVSCPNNSEQQGELFSTAISAGKCTSRSCYQRKTEAALSERRSEYAQDYPVVWLDIEKSEAQYANLTEEDVGRSQARTCRSCGDFGALLRTAPGQYGHVIGGLCFGLECRAEKMASYAESLKSLKGDDKAAAGSSGAADAGSATANGKTAKTKAKAKSKTTTNTTPSAVLRAAFGQVRATSARLACSSSHMLLALDVDALLSADGAKIPDAMKVEFDGQLGMSGPDRLAKLYDMSDEVLERLREGLLSERVRANAARIEALEGKPEYSAVVMALLGRSMAGEIEFTKEYVEAFSKAGLEVELENAGFPAWYDANKGADAFKKLIKGKKSVVVEAVLEAVSEGFTIDPSYLTEVVAKLETTANKRSES